MFKTSIRLVFCLLLSVLFFAFAGCGSGGSDSGGNGNTDYSIEFVGAPSGNVTFSGDNATTGYITITVTDGGAAASGVNIRVTAEMNDAANSVIDSSRRNLFYGISFGFSGTLNPISMTQNSTVGINGTFPTNTSGEITKIRLNDTIGQRTVTLKAEVISGTNVLATATKNIVFDKGPIGSFTAPVVTNTAWADANTYCISQSAALPTPSELNGIGMSGALLNSGWKIDRRYWITGDGNYIYFGQSDPTASAGYYTVCKKP